MTMGTLMYIIYLARWMETVRHGPVPGPRHLSCSEYFYFFDSRVCPRRFKLDREQLGVSHGTGSRAQGHEL